MLSSEGRFSLERLPSTSVKVKKLSKGPRSDGFELENSCVDEI